MVAHACMEFGVQGLKKEPHLHLVTGVCILRVLPLAWTWFFISNVNITVKGP